jgi:hypothetical protein
MKYRFLLHLLSHRIVVINITSFSLPTQIYPPDGERREVPAIRFQGWKDAERYLEMLGASTEMLKECYAELNKRSVAVLTII